MVKAVIFDMDGVISDTQKIHSAIESEILNRYGINLTSDQITDRYAGVRTTQFFKELLDEKKATYDLKELINEKWKKMKELSEKEVDAIPGSIEFIKDLHKNNIPLAVASSSHFDYVQTVLEKLEIIDMFQVIVSGDQVNKGKPDPESFLLAAKKINTNPEDCLVIEDGKSGMLAAKSAGMKCIGLVNDKHKDYPADILITDMHELSPQYIKTI